MMRWVRAGALVLCGAPRVLVATLLIFCVWGAVGEVVTAATTLPYRGEFAAVGLCSFNMPFAGMLFANFLKLARDLRELRLPHRRPLLAASLAFLVMLMVLAPSVLAWSWHTGLFDVLMVASAAIAGAGLGWLGTRRASAREPAGARKTATSSGRAQALRVALGPPYAPTSSVMRLAQLALLAAALAVAPVLVGVFGGSLSAANFAILLHVAELLSFIAAIVLCWIWPLSRVVVLFNPERGGLSELALLPGLGERDLQLRQLLKVVLTLPVAGLMALLVIALGVARLAHVADDTYIKLTLEFLLIPMVTLPELFGRIAQGRASRGRSVGFFMASQTGTLTVVVWTMSWNMFALLTLRWLIVAFALVSLTVVVAMSLHYLRRISQRPHLFMDVSS
jgi:hypothetical protein